MTKDRPVFVIDTNVLIDYPGVIIGENGKAPRDQIIDLSHAHLVIPTIVVREMSKFKGERSERGKMARTILRAVRDLTENDVHTLADIYHLRAPIEIADGQQLLSVLPVHKDFDKSLPFKPSSDDMDGQIILTAMAASMAIRGMRIDGQELCGTVDESVFDDVTILTNDNGLAIRARERGLKTARYGYKYPEPYKGRRNIIIPNELFHEFYCSEEHIIRRSDFESAMPEDEPRLVANEFVVMRLEDPSEHFAGFDPYHDDFFDSVGRYDVERDAIVRLRYTRDFPVHAENPGQAIYAEALADPTISAVICTGPAGSGKTYMATVYGLKACKKGEFIGVTAVPCENRCKIGALPGDLDEKMDPDVQPLKNALRNYFLHAEQGFRSELESLRKNGIGNGTTKTSLKNRLAEKVDLIWNNWFSSIPIELARGRDFSYELAIYDEFQDQNASQADTLIKRIGKKGKIVLTGDIEQIHAPYLDRDNNGLVYASRQLFDNPMVAQVHFDEDEVVRHDLVKEIARRQKSSQTNSLTD